MFDWNDEEITNIIWGENGESRDHIVPYANESEENSSGPYGDQTGKDWNQEAANRKPDEQKKPLSRTDFREVKLEGSSQYETNESLPAKQPGLKSWPPSSLSIAIETDKDSMGTIASNNLTEISEDDSSGQGQNAQLESTSEIFQNPPDRDQGDFVDYGWANIGSFDDLDRIFGNDDPIFGHASLSNVDELWSSSKDVTSSPEKSIPLSFDSPNMATRALRSSLDQFEVKSEYALDEDPFGFGKMTNVTSNTPHNVQACTESTECAGGKTKALQKDKIAIEASGKIPAVNEQVSAGVLAMQDRYVDKLFSCVQGNRKKGLLKPQMKSEEKSEVRQLQDICGTWSTSGNQLQEYDSQYATTMSQHHPPSVMSQQRQLLGPESSQYKPFPGPLLASSMYANISTQYPPMAALSQLPSGEGNHQKVIAGYEVPPANSDPLNTPSYAPMQPLPMTPQEKIEKLRWRQQMRAMLAIQKQQQQFNNQVASTEPPVMEGATSEAEGNLYVLPSIDPSSSIEQDDSNTICGLDDCSIEDSILHQLQDVIMKLDIRIRLCIRDSLFRLAQSASQRQFASDTSSNSRSGRNQVFNEEERNNQNWFGRMPDAETETNPIDRTVAHLLFHRPLESSGKHTETPGSPLPAKFPCDIQSADLMSSPRMLLPQTSESKKVFSHDEPKIPFLIPEGDESKDSPCLDTTEIASNNEAADGAVLGVEATQ